MILSHEKRKLNSAGPVFLWVQPLELTGPCVDTTLKKAEPLAYSIPIVNMLQSHYNS